MGEIPEGKYHIHIHEGSKEEPHGCIVPNSIWSHYKGGLYRITGVVWSHDLHNVPNQTTLIIYHKCDERGIWESIRDSEGGVEAHQPFCTTMSRWIKKYTFVKQLH